MKNDQQTKRQIKMSLLIASGLVWLQREGGRERESIKARVKGQKDLPLQCATLAVVPLEQSAPCVRL